MKKIILILAIVGMAIAGQSQTGQLVHIDTLVGQQSDTVFFKWYDEYFGNGINANYLESKISLTKVYVTDTLIFQKKVKWNKLKTIKMRLDETDSLKNPFGNNYFQYQTVANIIYNNGQEWRITFAKYSVLNAKDRLLE